MSADKKPQYAVNRPGRHKRAINFEALSRVKMAEAFGVSTQATNRWDCPRNEDGTFCLKDVIEWKVKKETSGQDREAQLKLQKLEKEIEYKDAQVQKVRESVIPIEEHERILIERGMAWRQLWKQSVLKMVNDFVGQPREVLLVKFEKFGKAISEAFIGG